MSLEVRYCPHCGTRRTGYFRFCGRCGFDFDDLAIGKPTDVAAAKAAPKPEPTTPIWPPPVQWPPPDATPTPAARQPEPEPAPAIARAPALPPPTPAPPVQKPAARPLLARSPAIPEAWPAGQPATPGSVTARRPALTWTRIAIVILAALLAVNAISRALSSSSGGSNTAPSVEIGSPLVGGSSGPGAPTAIPALTPGPSFGPTGATQVAVVKRIVDGDTIRVVIDGREYPVRYIGIDAPEPDSTDPATKQVADAATATNAALVEGQDVYLERDVSDTDPFDRLLRNVWLIDQGGSQVLVNLELVRLGFATVTTYPPDEKYEPLLTTAEASARAEKIGLWAVDAAPGAAPSP